MEKFIANLTLLTLRTIGRLPLPAGLFFGALLGRIAWLVGPREVQTTRRNIEACYPQLSAREQTALARQSVIESGRLAFEINIVWQRSTEWLYGQIVSISGEHLIAQRDKSRGLMILGPHVGNWEVLGAICSGYGPIAFLYQPPKKKHLEPLMIAARSKQGATQLPTDVRGVAGLMRTLKRGETIGILPDQNPDDNGGDFAELFGHQALTMTLVHKLLQKTGAQVIMGAAIRVPGGFAIHFWEAPAGIDSADEAESLRALNVGVEQSVALAPSQYQWEYKRFRRQPEGMPRFYHR